MNWKNLSAFALLALTTTAAFAEDTILPPLSCLAKGDSAIQSVTIAGEAIQQNIPAAEIVISDRYPTLVWIRTCSQSGSCREISAYAGVMRPASNRPTRLRSYHFDFLDENEATLPEAFAVNPQGTAEDFSATGVYVDLNTYETSEFDCKKYDPKPARLGVSGHN